MTKLPFYKQLDSMDCGPTVLKMIAGSYNVNCSIDYLREITNVGKTGSSLLDLNKAAESIGFKSKGGLFSLDYLSTQVNLPCILHWNQNHFVVLYNIETKRNKTRYHVADPGKGLLPYSEEEFMNHWKVSQINNEDVGVALIMEPTSKLENLPDEFLEKRQNFTGKLGTLTKYFSNHKVAFYKLIFALFIGSILQLIFPFLTQSIVDKGITNQDFNLIYLILVAQFMLILSKTGIDFVRRRILLRVSTKINISLLSDFFKKLMKLPMSFFDKKLLGDIMQRIEDHKRVETFLTVRTLSLIFSFFSFIVFSIVLIIYQFNIFLIFISGSILYGIWLACFLRKRKSLDYDSFEKQAINQNKIYQLIYGMQDIKLQGIEDAKRDDWEKTQKDLFNLKFKILSLQQLQEAGGVFINEFKNIIITALSAILVIKGDITLGMMLSIQYIIGQLNAPVIQLLNFIYDWQDVNISLDRINEIHLKDDENEHRDVMKLRNKSNQDIIIKNLCFKYPGANSRNIIDNISITIPSGKVTAIVGASGSGKTTLIKLLLGHYKPNSGEITIGGILLDQINLTWWRTQCGVVSQEGFIFSESIAENITANDNDISKDKLSKTSDMANISEFINKLPLKYDTTVGQDGQGLSQGQKQRLLIARAIYKNPQFLFLDEATNALDANNEKSIVENMSKFYEGKTVIVVAHRLSTVKYADQIIVLNDGAISECGTHEELTNKKGMYYSLVKNQLELGN